MGISWRTTDWLNQAGHDAVHLVTEGLEKSSDSEIIEKAIRESRVVLTMDLDFSHILSASKTSVPSVVLFRLSDERPDSVNRRLELVLECSEDALKNGAIISVTDRLIRVRQLPI